MRTCDLHIHSNFSDGTCPPSELVSMAKSVGLCAVALCDHNTTQGLYEFLASGREQGIETVAGIEISSEYRGHELHILGLFLPMDRLDEINSFLAVINERKDKANEQLVRKLKADGYDISLEKIKAQTPTGHINRAHIASALVSAGYAENNNDAFKKILAPDGKYYKPPLRYTALEVIEFLKGIGACAVLAHPFLSMSYEETEEFLPLANAHGLDGMETLYSEYSEEDTKRAAELANKYGLLQSGGSDFHGDRKPNISLGIGRGNLNIPYEFAEKLKNNG